MQLECQRVSADSQTVVLAAPPSELISPPPDFDLSKAQRAKNFALKFVDGQLGWDGSIFDSLKLAIALSRYNFLQESITFREEKIFMGQAMRLLGNEVSASKSPLPTIGIEVESPQKPFKHQNAFKYKEFFDSVGMPRNKANTKPDETTRYWEFSPAPSYSAGVQARILSELIKGKFLPHLLDSQDPRDIRKYLDDKFVSLHVNLGIPPFISEGPYEHREFKMFGVLLALAFSSPERLRGRLSETFYIVDAGEITQKNCSDNPLRLEVKALEVRNQSVYRAIETAQVLGASMFAYCLDPELKEADYWKRVKREIIIEHEVLRNRGLGKKEVADLAFSTDVGCRVRRLIDQYRLL